MIFKRELVKAQKGLWIWFTILGGLIVMMLSMYPEISKSTENINELLESYPDALKAAFNIDQLGFDTVIGFYSIEGYLFATLFGSIFAVLLAGNIVVKEESDKTAEFLLSKPITRKEVITQKLFALLAAITQFNILLSAATFIGFKIGSDEVVPLKVFLLISIAPFLLHITFASLAFLVSSVMRKSKSIMSISLGIVFVTYFLNILASITNKAEFLKYFSPFEYIDSVTIIVEQTIKPLYLVCMTLIICVSIVASYVIYHKKDLAV
ncbi:multidrug ABC transporter permease [Lottiidibacillus patelloidae]|uniref:Multidrug ABC transporter permease n=1 Tax=Lottiidibacillus patelloidae TaxID=2670334 RepID=A0A263BSZ7_9BACI|nr:ABC transporter permease subunit [Lottiidibacillus patelloidae]OZM56688.1 multidrug ABC transporter permease [Lottiidibacillus patelloidae]